MYWLRYGILDFKEDRKISILSGRPFLATYKSTIDLEQNELIIKIDDEIELFKSGWYSQSDGLAREECYPLFNLTLNSLDSRHLFDCVGVEN
ncbi:hypothetical protein EPI10_006532 [Gossypium australe]|uniref:Uncharacterized protein n=1 Tax=Gossypium australe TaxID=47621 RepID=A0A5B6WSV4_9ROSI|nr:hypothetical protein EPI10_006532 [Gossypium australe]